MLRNSFLHRYEDKQYKYKVKDMHLLRDEEEYRVLINRPLEPKEISKLSQKHLFGFVDDVLTNKRVSSVLYSSTSASEIGDYLHKNKVMEKNSTPRITKYKADHPSSMPVSVSTSASRMNEYRNQYNKVKEHIRSYKKSKVTHISLLTKKNDLFINTIKKQTKERVNKEKVFHKINTLRLKNYYRSIKRCKSQIGKNPFFELPDVKLDVKNVYSRLYYNEILINRSKTEDRNIRKHKKIKVDINANANAKERYNYRSTTNKKNYSSTNLLISNRRYTSNNSSTWSNHSNTYSNGNVNVNGNGNPNDTTNHTNDNNNTNTEDQRKESFMFNLKHVIKSANGKEFTMKVTDRVFTKCLYKHSGGPMTKECAFYLKNKDEEESDTDNEHLISLTKIKDDKGNSYLHDAVKDGSYEFVKYYLGKQLSPNEQNDNGNTPLHLAMKVQIPEIIQLLLDNKADLTIENANKETPYDLAPIHIKKRLKLDRKLIDKINNPSALLIVK